MVVSRYKISLATILLIVGLVACDLGYFLPRQVTIYQNYSGLPTGYNVDLAAIYHAPLHHAIVVTNDVTFYQYVLFALNDPYLHNDIIYAVANDHSQYRELLAAYPGRTLYQIEIETDGSVQYAQVKDP